MFLSGSSSITIIYLYEDYKPLGDDSVIKQYWLKGQTHLV